MHVPAHHKERRGREDGGPALEGGGKEGGESGWVMAPKGDGGKETQEGTDEDGVEENLSAHGEG
jgi:hypothetical protein